jgi:hypothetical protein
MKPKYMTMTLITWMFFIATVMAAVASPNMIAWTIPGMLAWFVGTIGLVADIRRVTKSG